MTYMLKISHAMDAEKKAFMNSEGVFIRSIHRKKLESVNGHGAKISAYSIRCVSKSGCRFVRRILFFAFCISEVSVWVSIRRRFLMTHEISRVDFHHKHMFDFRRFKSHVANCLANFKCEYLAASIENTWLKFNLGAKVDLLIIVFPGNG